MEVFSEPAEDFVAAPAEVEGSDVETPLALLNNPAFVAFAAFAAFEVPGALAEEADADPNELNP